MIGQSRKLGETIHGMSIYDCKGISVLFSDYCIQEQANDNDVRSIVFHEDGHLYTLWNSAASMRF